jgi:cytosine/adenosine deaminase-related metal-dependent hydrolase
MWYRSGLARSAPSGDRSIEAGKRADLAVLDYRAFGLTPTFDPV